MRNLFIRAISAFIILMISMILYHFDCVVYGLIFVQFMMLYEWKLMPHINYYMNNIVGFLLINSAILSLIFIYQKNLIVFYFISIWGVDLFAYLGGKSIGGPKLCPHISPKKTLSGLLCGVVASMIVSHIFSFSIFFGFCFGILAQLSDIFVSYFKRKANIKDTGNLIPGHGGFLDRFDSIILTAPFLSFTIYFFL